MSSVSGVGSTEFPYMPHENTSTSFVNLYKDLMRNIQSAVTNGNPEEFQEALDALDKLLKEGLTEDGQTFYATSEMLKDIDVVYKLLDEVGFVPGVGYQGPLTPEQGLKILKDFRTNDGTTFNTVMSNAINISGANKNLHSLQVDFFRQVNATYEKILSELNEALETTKKIIELLTSTRYVANRISPANPGDYVMPPTKLSDIPPVIQDQMRQMKPTPPMDNPTELKKWFENAENLNKYVDISKPYFGPIAGIPDESTINESAAELIEARNELKIELQHLKNRGGSDSLVKSMEDLIKRLDDCLESYDTAVADLASTKQLLADTFTARDAKMARLDTVQKEIADLETALEGNEGTREQIDQLFALRGERFQLQGQIASSNRSIAQIETTIIPQKEASIALKAKEGARTFIADTDKKTSETISKATTNANNLSDSQLDELLKENGTYEKFLSLATALEEMISNLLRDLAKKVAGG